MNLSKSIQKYRAIFQKQKGKHLFRADINLGAKKKG